MREQLQQRLDDLREEFEAGQKMMADLEARQTELRETLLRISGAIQVLVETLGTAEEVPLNGTSPEQSEPVQTAESSNA